MTVTLYLVRHAIAEEHAASGRDEDRRLTPEGAGKMRRAALGLQGLGVAPGAIWSSPLVRARQTAEILSAVLGGGGKVTLRDVLAPGHPSAAVLEAVRALRGVRSVMLVGHEPDLGRLGSYLLTGSPSRAQLPFKKGATAAFELGADAAGAPAELRWFLTPRQLRALGRKS